MTLDTACPKPVKAPKRPRKPLPPSSHPIPRGRPKPVNANRRTREYARTYHSKARVEFIKSMPCAYCRARDCVNAHTTGGGMSRKGDYTTIAPLCHRCHSAYDEHRFPFNSPLARTGIAFAAEYAERAWLAFAGGEAATLNSPQTESSLIVAGGADR